MLKLHQKLTTLENRQNDVKKFFTEPVQIKLKPKIGNSIPLPRIFRMNVVGATNTGKSFFIRNIMYAMKWDNIYLFCPSKISLNQPTWNCFPNITKIVLTPETKPMKFKENSIIVLDDLDQIRNHFIEELFTIESHHSSLSVVKISHNLKCRDPIIRINTEFLVMFNMPSGNVEKMCQEYLLDKDIQEQIKKLLVRKSGLFVNKDKICSNYNNVIVDFRNIATLEGERERIYTMESIF